MIYLIIIYYLYSKAVTENREILFAVGYQHGFAFYHWPIIRTNYTKNKLAFRTFIFEELYAKIKLLKNHYFKKSSMRRATNKKNKSLKNLCISQI